MPHSPMSAHVDTSLLELYLNDHLAGAAAGRARIQRMAGGYQDLSFADDLAGLAAQIAADYERLAELIEQLGLRRLRYRQAAAAVGERLGRLKLNRRLIARSPMTPLLEIEFMRGAVAAKQGLWDLLVSIAPQVGLDATEFVERSRSASQQLATLASIHARYAPQAFSADERQQSRG